MKKYILPLFFGVLASLMFLFQFSVWATVRPPESDSTLEFFWFTIVFTAPFVMGMGLVKIAEYFNDKIKKDGKEDINSGEKSDFSKKSF